MPKSTKEEGGMATMQGGVDDAIRKSTCFQAVLGFFFNKGVRGGPRVLLNLAAVLVGLFIFVKLLPSYMTESAMNAIPSPKTVWSGLGVGKNKADGLRIVVFGELDIGTPVGADQEVEDAQSWTQKLCDQLECDVHITMVPPPEIAPWSVSSNDLYAQGIETVLNETDDQAGPGQDFSYLSTSYPPQWKSWDLKKQVDGFLAMPKGKTPQATLWVFSFGLWDVWSLAALPVAKGRETVDSMTRDIFEQVERLYTASLDPTSIAYSHLKTAKKVPAESLNVSESVGSVPAGNETEAHDDDPVEEQATPESESVMQPAATEATTTEEQTPEDPERFDILISQVFDPSLLPGWRDLRPQIPSAHSKAEQMRNSAILTAEWNDRIADRMIDWVRKDEVAAEAGKDKGADFYVEDVDTIAPAAPLRDGFAYNLADYVIDRMVERQMQNAHLTDGNGRGDSAVEEGYRDVRNPCLKPVGIARVTTTSGPVVEDVVLNIPNEKILDDKQQPKKGTSGTVKRAEFEEKAGLAYLSAAKVCDIPDDHLFFTPFALSQRAIQGIADETAEKIRSGESVRVRLAKKE